MAQSSMQSCSLCHIDYVTKTMRHRLCNILSGTIDIVASVQDITWYIYISGDLTTNSFSNLSSKISSNKYSLDKYFNCVHSRCYKFNYHLYQVSFYQMNSILYTEPLFLIKKYLLRQREYIWSVRQRLKCKMKISCFRI